MPLPAPKAHLLSLACFQQQVLRPGSLETGLS